MREKSKVILVRIKAVIAYDGSRFSGSQIQPDTLTVAGKIQSALSQIGINTTVHMSGRTDAGVHATGQVMHLDIPSYWEDLEKFHNYLQPLLLPHITLKRIITVDSEFHARFHAIKRQYRYLISTKAPSPFSAPYITHVKAFDLPKVQKTIQCFEGEHDFSNFMKSGSEIPHARRTIYQTKAYAHKDFYICAFEANGFLRSQIRLMMGFLLKISSGTLGEKELLEQLSLKACYNTLPAPSNGLYLSHIFYNQNGWIKAF